MLSRSSHSSLNQLEFELFDAGKKLLRMRSWSPNIHNVLAILKDNLSKVEQMPSQLMKDALQPVIEALVTNKLVRHPDMEVNISVACCFCEILRINLNAPAIPYTDEQLKDFLKMVVITFEKLSSASGGCFTKMSRVLEIFSRNSLCLLMLDLQLDGARLVVRLFEQFLTVADSNPSAVVHEMEKIMTMIILESRELKPKLVDLLVKFSKNKNQSASHGCWQLGEKVLMNFAAQFKPNFAAMGRDMSYALYDYSILVASTCKSKIKTECLETVMHCQQEPTASFYDPATSVTEVNGTCKRNNSQTEKQVSSSESGGTICVQGYEVKESIAEMLEAIFEKHGDIAANCIFETSFMMSSILEVICEAVRRIQTNEVVEKMDETDSLVSDAEAVNIDVAWLRAHLEAIRKKTEGLERSNLLRKTTKHTLLAERVARKDVKETDAEVVAALERVEWAEMLVHVLAVVEKNLDVKLMECKAKLDSLDSWVQQPFL